MQPRKVLIVDDEYLIRWALIKTLKEAGYEVAAAEDGMEAFEMAEKECFDFVITDLSMPGLDGWSLLEMLVHLPVSPRVIVITAHGEENFLTRVKDSGGWAYVEKSCLIDGVKEVLEAASLG